ncbi:MAG: N-acetyltransferase [Acidimicrobiia bacterium]
MTTTDGSEVGDEPSEPLETGWLDGTPVDDSLLRRFVIGFGEWIETSARAAGHAVLRTDDVVAVDEHADHKLLNCGILLRPLTAERAGELLADLTGFYTGAGAPFSLFSPWPADVPGLVIGGHPPVMLRMPGNVPAGAGDAAGLDVREVTTRALLAEYERVLVEGFPLDSLATDRGGVALHPSSLHVPGMRMFVGLVDGRGVTGATSILGHGVNHVEWVATLDAARGKGYGAAITWAATLVDPALPALLVASDLGRPVYERMGYVVLDRWTFLVGTR